MQQSFKPWYWCEAQFLVSGVTTKLIPSSGTPEEDISLWPEILPFQQEFPASMTYFWQSCQRLFHKLCIRQQTTGAPIQIRSILRRGSGKKGGLFPHYYFKSNTSFAAPVYKRKNKALWQQMIKADTSGPPKPWSGILVSSRRAKYRVNS